MVLELGVGGSPDANSLVLSPFDCCQVERVRDGNSFANRKVDAVQNGRPIFSSITSFHRSEESEIEYAGRSAVGGEGVGLWSCVSEDDMQ